MRDLSENYDKLAGSLSDSASILGIELDPPSGERCDHSQGSEGSFLTVSCKSTSFILGISGGIEDLRKIANLMLGIEDGDEPLPQSDVSDAVGEFVNVLAGSLKQQLVASYDSVQIGLPLFSTGGVAFPSSAQCLSQSVQMSDGSTIYLVLAQDQARKDAASSGEGQAA